MRLSAATKTLYLGGMAVVMVIMLFPFAVMLSTALKSPGEVVGYAQSRYHLIPQHPTPGNFVECFRAMPLGMSFLSSLIIASGATLVNILCAVPAAYALSRLEFPGKRALLFLILVTQMFAPIVLVLALFAQFQAYHLLELDQGLANALRWLHIEPAGAALTVLTGWKVFAALILVNAAVSLAFSIWLLSGYFSTVPREIEDAALIDGCSRLQTVRQVLLPLSLPGLVTTIIFAFIAAWNEYVFALTFVPTDDLRPLTVAIPSFIGQYETQWHLLMAAALLATLPVMALFLTVEKHLVRGLTAGGIK
jgi:multiple sugar transport system permease protein